MPTNWHPILLTTITAFLSPQEPSQLLILLFFFDSRERKRSSKCCNWCMLSRKDWFSVGHNHSEDYTKNKNAKNRENWMQNNGFLM